MVHSFQAIGETCGYLDKLVLVAKQIVTTLWLSSRIEVESLWRGENVLIFWKTCPQNLAEMEHMGRVEALNCDNYFGRFDVILLSDSIFKRFGSLVELAVENEQVVGARA